MNGLRRHENYFNFQTVYGFYIGSVFQTKSVTSSSCSVVLLNIWEAFTQNAYLRLQNVRCRNELQSGTSSRDAIFKSYA